MKDDEAREAIEQLVELGFNTNKSINSLLEVVRVLLARVELLESKTKDLP